MPVEIFPRWIIPVSVSCGPTRMNAQDIQNRSDSASSADGPIVRDIARIEATSYQGVGVEKVYLQEGADVTPRCRSREQCPRRLNTCRRTSPALVAFATARPTYPIHSSRLSSNSLPDTKPQRSGSETIRARPGCSCMVLPCRIPSGGKPRVIWPTSTAGTAGRAA